MSDLITGIRLSTGKVIKFPIFPQLDFSTVERIKTTRAITPLFDIQGTSGGGQVVYQALNNSEIIELFNILGMGGDGTTTLDYNANINQGHAISALNWFCDSNGDYLLHIPCTYYPNTNTYKVNFGNFAESAYTRAYYNGLNSHEPDTPEFPTHYADVTIGNAQNVRTGSPYSLDISYVNYQPIMFGAGRNLTNINIKAAIDDYSEENPDDHIGYIVSDNDNPFGPIISDGGGGDGDGDEAGIDEITKMDVPDLPTIDVNSCGFITTYSPTLGQLQALANFLWSSAFDIDSFKKLFTSPMECIIGLGIVPVEPEYTGAETVKFGDVSTGVSMVKCKQYARKSCGSVSIKRYIGSFLDYSPYVKISIYLPYIGIRELSADDVMNDTVSVDYNIDVLTGGLAAIVSTSKKGVLYQYNGNCITNVPLTSINYSQAIQNAVSAVGSIATMTVGAVTGAAPIAAMGATSLATQAANTAINSKPTVQRSGSMGGSAGMLSVQTPYLIINRPKLSVPDKLNKFTGNTYNVTRKLSTLRGFTMVDYIHLDGIPCTENERKELLSILKEGVIL